MTIATPSAHPLAYWSAPGSDDTWIFPCFRGVRVLESAGDGGWSVLVFVLGRGEHIQGAVSSSGVVEQLDVIVDGGGQFDAGLSSLAVE
jgi:hypothetical protein